MNASPALILHHLDYGEADRIVTFLTPEHGRMKGFARGARKSRRRFGAALEPFASVRLQWKSRGGDLVSLTDAELLNLRVGLRSSLGAIALAGYGCELSEALLGEESGPPDLFELLQAFLDHLDAGGALPEARLLFEVRILNLAGYMPHLLHCSECGEKPSGEEADFDAARSGTLCTACAGGRAPLKVGTGTLGTLARLLRTPPDLFQGVRLGSRTLTEGGAMLRSAIALHLHRPLKSVKMLEAEMVRSEEPLRGSKSHVPS